MLEVAPHRRAEHQAVDPRFAGLLLGDRARPVLRTERSHRRRAVEPSEVVALATAAVIKDALAAVDVPRGREPRGDLGDRGVPIDLLERAVRAPAERVEHALAPAVLIVIEAQRFLAGIALRGRMRLVAADLREAAAVLAAELDE